LVHAGLGRPSGRCGIAGNSGLLKGEASARSATVLFAAIEAL
jgi:hypothetical protein